MKFKNILAAALIAVGVAGAAQAQSNTQVYGVIGAGIVSGSGFTSSNYDFTGVTDQAHNSNRFGIKGSEDLGDGLKANFQLESNFSARDGAAGKDSAGTGTNGTVLFDREANVGLSGGFGEVKLGRGKNFLYNVLDEFDSRGNWNFGGLKPIARYAGFYSGSGVSRFDNMVRWSSKDFGGVKFDYAKSFGNQPEDTAYKASTNVGVRYTNGPLDVAYTHEEARLSSSVISEKIDLYAVKYDVTPALTVNVGYVKTDNPSALSNYYASSTKADGKTDAETVFVGAKYKINANLGVNVGYYNVQDKVTGGINDVKMNAVGVTYDFSKRTQVFADYVVASRAGGANAPFTVYDRWVPSQDATTFSDSKYKQNAVAVGIQHRF